MTEKNLYTHYYLYAKGWYEKSDNQLYDLRVITSKYSGLKTEHITPMDVTSVLINAVTQSMEHFKLKDKTIFRAFVYRMLDEETSIDGFIRASLEQLMRTKGENLNLDKPSENVLALSDDEALERWEEMHKE